MLIIPHSTALDLEGHAYTTYAVTILCIIIFYFQFSNQNNVQRSVFEYCNSIHDPRQSSDSIDVMRSNVGMCGYFMSMYHNNVEFIIPDILKEITGDESFRYNAQMDEIVDLMQGHHDAFAKEAPESLDAKLMYYPDYFNPIKMITSSLSHGDIPHIAGNIIFFLAFAPALELLVGNVLRYLGILLIIAFSTCISYSLVVLVGGGHAIPTLGLSGVVMGMIGLSAYLMPKAKIRVFIWFFTLARNFYISAWILAVWYIGWDAWTLLTSSDYGGVNLISHVSGGITGYLIGKFWLKETRDDNQEDLDDEIEYQRSKLADRFTAHNVTFSGNRQYIDNKKQERQRKRDENEYMGRLYQYVGAHNDSDAIVLILEDYDFQCGYVEYYEDLFQRVTEWGNSRTALCIGRICITLLLGSRLYQRALVIFEQCYKISNNFVLSDPGEVLLLANGVKELEQFETAYNVVTNAEQRYGKYIDATKCQLMEVELLSLHMDKLDDAHRIMAILLTKKESEYSKQIMDLAVKLQRIN